MTTATIAGATMTDELAEMFRDGALTVDRAVKEFSVGRTKIYEWMTKGKLPFSRPDGRRLIPRRALMELLAKGMSDEQ